MMQSLPDKVIVYLRTNKISMHKFAAACDISWKVFKEFMDGRESELDPKIRCRIKNQIAGTPQQ